MSDHPKEAQRNLKRIRVCDDIFFDVFRLLAPSKVGLELALVSDRFDTLVDTHYKSRKWALGTLMIKADNVVKTNEDWSQKTLPFPQKLLPNSIVGFARFDFRSINPDAIALFQCIGHLLRSDVTLELDIKGEPNWNSFTSSIWPLLNVSAIIKIRFQLSSDFHHFRRLISPSILRDCSNVRMITVDIGQFFQFPPDDSKGSSDDQALCKWLLTPRADGQPKGLKWRHAGDQFPMAALTTSFLNATTSVSFILCLPFYSYVGSFELVNSRTNEQLTSRQLSNNVLLIERSPIDKNAEKWAEWEREALEYGAIDWKVIDLCFR